jgi:hypothetical protein
VFWNDTTGKKIQAHGGGFLEVGDTWYWFGEDKTMNTGGTGNFYAVSCYASTDLVTWEFRNSVVTRNTNSQLNVATRVIERPKVIYNESTRQYVMWAHWDNTNYNDSQAVIFQSATVDGNYTYVKNFKPGGNDSRDCALFKDDNGTASFISVANTNADMMVYALTSDYLDVQQRRPRSGPGSTAKRPPFSRSVAPATASPPNPPAGRQTRGVTRRPRRFAVRGPILSTSATTRHFNLSPPT